MVSWTPRNVRHVGLISRRHNNHVHSDRGSALDPAGAAYSDPPDDLAGGPPRAAFGSLGLAVDPLESLVNF